MSRKQIDDFTNALAKSARPYEWCEREFLGIDEFSHLDFDLANIELLGLGVELNAQNELSLRSKSTKIKDETFCVIDIEATGSLHTGQIIEIGALKIRAGLEVASFETLVKAAQVPENITSLTGISANMLKNAPSLASALNEFRIFLKDAIFVAHNAQYDYDFISQSLEKYGFGVLLNQKLCTVELSRRIIPSKRYGLDALKQILRIKTPHHRAMSDAKAAAYILRHCLARLPSYIQTTQDLLNFSTSNAKPNENLFAKNA